jgi:predicted nucleic acid-binding protein
LKLYAESSAVVAWLLGEASQDAVRDALSKAEVVLSSDITLVECDRVLIRATVAGRITEGQAADRRAALNEAARHWGIIHMDDEVFERARRPFPVEPIRTLDALHLASALMARSAVAGLSLLTLDRRIRATAHKLGFDILPPD